MRQVTKGLLEAPVDRSFTVTRKVTSCELLTGTRPWQKTFQTSSFSAPLPTVSDSHFTSKSGTLRGGGV